MRGVRTSWVWNHFTPHIETRAGKLIRLGGYCKICPNKRFVSSEGNTSNLQKHLLTSHNLRKYYQPPANNTDNVAVDNPIAPPAKHKASAQARIHGGSDRGDRFPQQVLPLQSLTLRDRAPPSLEPSAGSAPASASSSVMTSWVWNHFNPHLETRNGKLKRLGGFCQICPNKRFVSSEGNTSNLQKHLLTSHNLRKYYQPPANNTDNVAVDNPIAPSAEHGASASTIVMTSWVWNHFNPHLETRNGKLKSLGGFCQICPNKRFVSSEGNTSNLQKHLLTSHNLSKYDQLPANNIDNVAVNNPIAPSAEHGASSSSIEVMPRLLRNTSSVSGSIEKTVTLRNRAFHLCKQRKSSINPGNTVVGGRRRVRLKSTAVPSLNLPEPAKVVYKKFTKPSTATSTGSTSKTYTMYENRKRTTKKKTINTKTRNRINTDDESSLNKGSIEEEETCDYLAPVDFINMGHIKTEEVELTDTLLLPEGETSTDSASESMPLSFSPEHTSEQSALVTESQKSFQSILPCPNKVFNINRKWGNPAFCVQDPLSQVETQWKDMEIEFLPVSLAGETLDQYEEEMQPGATLLERCRVCARVAEHAVEIFSSEGQQRRLVEKIQTFLPISVSEDDRLPLRVCESCEATLEASQQLQELSLRANEALNDLLQQQEQELEQECGSPAEPVTMHVDATHAGPSTVTTGNMEANPVPATAGPSKYLPMPPAPAHLQCQMCSVGCYSAKSLKDHYFNVHYSYMCLHCCDWFDTSMDRNKHIDETHKIKCPFCDSLELKEYMRSHIHTEHQDLKPKVLNNAKARIEEEVVCKICKGKFGNVLAAKFHCFWEHQQYACEVCMELFSSLEPQLKHTEEIHMIPCWYCEEKFYTPRTLKRHVNKYHREQSSDILPPLKSENHVYECRSCKKGVSSKLFLKRHNFWSHGTITCDFCMLEFRNVSLEEQHFHEIHSSVCGVCHEEVSGTLSVHLVASHPDEQPFCCESCGKAFCSRDQLARHRKEHEVKRAFLCDSCGKSYRLKPNLVLHKKLIHMSKEDTFNLQCEYCSKRFRFQSQLNSHLLLHTQQKQFKCLDCSKSFLTALSLKSHMKTHSETRRLKCELCEAKFSSKKNLLSHVEALHCSREVLKCCLCDKSFESQQDAEFHMSFHAVEQVSQLEQPFVRVATFQCEMCTKRFSSKVTLNSHMMKHLTVRKKS